jgi:hypothetical protein
VVSSILEHTTLNGVLRQKDQKTGVKSNSINAILAVGYRSLLYVLRSFVFGIIGTIGWPRLEYFFNLNFLPGYERRISFLQIG